jgi:hypothetical protein
MNISKLILSVALSIFFGFTLSAHSTSGFFVTNGTDCYFVMTNWHPSIGDQNTSLTSNDGVFFDFNLDGLYNGTLDPTMGPYAPSTGPEYYPFTNEIDISDLSHVAPASATSFMTWTGEIEDWFTANVGSGYTATVVWDPTADTQCSGGLGAGGISYYALVSPLGACPTVAGNYTAGVADGSATSEPCGMALGEDLGAFDLDLSGVIVTPPTTVIPTMGEWGLICLGFLFLIVGVVSVRQRSQEFELN